MKLKTSSILLALALSTLVLLPALAGEQERSGRKLDEEFFIVSSIDTKKQQVLLKRPTEVTELMLVTEKTAFQDEQGKPLRLSDFRAGDTVYVTSYADSSGARVARRLRKGPMTVKGLKRSYLKSIPG